MPIFQRLLRSMLSLLLIEFWVNLDFNFLDCQFLVFIFLENDPNSLISVSYPKLNILTYPSQWQMPIIFYILPVYMAVSPPLANCEQALQDAVAVGPFHTTANAPWRTCTPATPLLENTYLILCSSRKCTYDLPTEGTFALDPPPPWNFHPRGYVLDPPAPPGISVIFELGWVPSGKNICVKILLHYIIMRKVIFSAIK